MIHGTVNFMNVDIHRRGKKKINLDIGIISSQTEMKFVQYWAALFDWPKGGTHRKTLKLGSSIRCFLKAFVKNCASANSYNLGEFVSINKKSKAFIDRGSFIQYSPNKPAKNVIKVFALCDTRSFYTEFL